MKQMMVRKQERLPPKDYDVYAEKQFNLI